MKRVFTMLLTCTMLLNLIVAVPASAAVDNSKYIPKIIGLDGTAALAFDPNLARIARKMSSDAYGVVEGSSATSVAKTLSAEGFVDIQQHHYSEDSSMASVSNNFLVGAKTFEVDGRKKHVIAIAFRGTKLTENDLDDKLSDLLTDASCWAFDGIHIGFRAAAIEGYNTLCSMKFDSLNMTFKDYLKKCYDSNDYYILVTGHSLGGAVANIFTGEILTKYEGIWSNAMCYTFASPKVCSENKERLRDAYNVFNIINTEDIVPKAGYQINKGVRFGTDLKATVSTGNLFKNHAINGTYEKVTEQIINNIDSLYKYTIPYYNRWRKEVLGVDDTSSSNGGGFRGETDNTGKNNDSLGNSIVGVVDIPSSWDNLSIRSGPSTNYQIVGSMNNGVRCNVYPDKTQNGWYYIEYNGIYGYASGNQINTSGSSTPTPSTPTPSTPAAISFSKSQLNLDYTSHPSETITITASGDLPKPYHLDFKFDSALSVTSGQWNGNSISTTIEMKGGPVKDNKVEVYLKDSSNNVYATNTIYVNATVPIIKQNTEIVLSKDNISIHFPDKQYEKMFVTIEGPILDNSTISIDTNESVTFEWGEWSNNRAELTIQSSRAIPANYTPCGYATIYIKDGNGNIYASKQFNLTSTVAKYTVRYDANGGYDAPDTHYIYHNHWDERVSSHIPKREGYKFEGWSTSKNGKVEYGRSQQLMEDHDIVFYAVWEKIEDLFSLEFDVHSIHDDTSEAVEYYIDGDRFRIADIVFHCDKNIECNWGMVKNKDGSHSIILQIDRNGDIASNKLSFDVIDEDGYILFSDSLSVFENYNEKQQFSDRNKNGITVYVDGEKLYFDVQPRLINSRTMVPMRAIFEALGADVYWDNNTQTAFGETLNDLIEISIGDSYLLKNGEYVALDSPAVEISGRTLVPVRAIAESLDCVVNWHEDSNVVEIISNKKNEEFQDKIKYESAKILDNGIYRIATKLNPSFYLDSRFAEKGSNMILNEKNATQTQLFKITYIGNSCYSIVSVSSGDWMSIAWKDEERGATTMEPDKATSSQLWNIEYVGDSSYLISNYSYDHLYLDVENAWADNEANVGLFVRNDAYDAQEWIFIRQ